MKKGVSVCILFILLFMLFGCGDSKTYDNSGEFWISEDESYSITAPDGFIIDTEDPDGFIYIYEDEKSIPYIMLKKYPYEGTQAAFEKEYTTSLKENYKDNSFTLDSRMNNNIGGKKVTVLESYYKLDDYKVYDMRCILPGDNCFYVFTMKEVPALNHNLISELDFVLKNFTVL